MFVRCFLRLVKDICQEKVEFIFTVATNAVGLTLIQHKIKMDLKLFPNIMSLKINIAEIKHEIT